VKELIKKLTEAYGPSGHEEQVRALIQEEIAGLADEVQVDALGNLIALRQGDGQGRKVMLSAHMDEIGVMVTHVDDKGFLRFTRIGGVVPPTLPGNRVLFANGTVGVINVEKGIFDAVGKKLPPLEKFYIDVGAQDKDSVPVGVGDAAAFLREMSDLGDRVVAKAMDDRIGCAVLIETMRRLKKTPHQVAFVFSVQEEVGLRGARTSAFGLDPDVGIAVDVTGTGDCPEDRPMAVSLGKGPAIKVRDSGMLAHPGLKELMIRRAEEAGIPYQLEVLPMGSTDAMAIQVTREGVPAGCLSIPCRHIHSPSEMVDIRDVENAVRLMVTILENPIVW